MTVMGQSPIRTGAYTAWLARVSGREQFALDERSHGFRKPP
jgi:hypothetical protein